MANQISLYDRRSLMELEEELLKPDQFLTKNFFGKTEQQMEFIIDVDLKRGNRRTVPYVWHHEAGPNIEKNGYKTSSFEPPTLKPKKTLSVKDFKKRVAGMRIFASDGSLTADAERLVFDQIEDLNNEIQRNEEVQAMQAIFDGEIKFYDENKDLKSTINFGRESELTETLGTKWDASGANPLGDLKEYRRLIYKHSGFKSNIVLLGVEAADEFLSNPIVKDAINKDYGRRGEWVYELEDDGAVWLGRVDGFELFSLEDYYIDPSDDTEKLVVPEKKVLIGSRDAGTRVYAAIAAADDAGGVNLDPVSGRYVDIYTGSRDPVGIVAQVHSTPLMVPTHPNAFACLTVLS